MSTKDKQEEVERDIHVVDPKLQSIIDKGYEIRETKKLIRGEIEELVTGLIAKFPGQEKTIASGLEGARMEIQFELESWKLKSLESKKG